MKIPTIKNIKCLYEDHKEVSGHKYTPCSIGTIAVFKNSSMCESVKHLDLITRIGSDSSNAHVFRDEKKGCNIAIKVMVPTDTMSLDSIKKEIELSVYASKLSSKYFIPVYAYGKCNEIELLPDTDLYIRGKEHFISKGNPYKGFFTGYIMIQELLWGDLRQFIGLVRDCKLSEKIHYEFLIELFTKIIDSISYMHSNRIQHNDLHMGNVFIRVYLDEKYDVLMGDFGSSSLLMKEEEIPKFFGLKDIEILANEISNVSDKSIHPKVKTMFSMFYSSVQNKGTGNLKKQWNDILSP